MYDVVVDVLVYRLAEEEVPLALTRYEQKNSSAELNVSSIGVETRLSRL